MTTIPQVLFEQARRRPEALAIENGDWRLSYGALAEQVKQAAGVMRGMGWGMVINLGYGPPIAQSGLSSL